MCVSNLLLEAWLIAWVNRVVLGRIEMNMQTEQGRSTRLIWTYNYHAADVYVMNLVEAETSRKVWRR